MGLFNNLFNRNTTIKEETRFNGYEENSQRTNSFVNSERTQEKKSPICVFAPKDYQEVASIINVLKNHKNAVVHLTALKPETAIRILDMLSGAVYALGGGVYEMQKNIFMFSPDGVEVNQ